MSYNKFIFLFLIFTFQLISQGNVGSFSRIGNDARTVSMGNSGVSLIHFPNSGYHNPATIAFMQNTQANATYTFLSLDRNFQTINFAQKIEPRGAFSLGLIASGISNIDLRDGNGTQLGTMSTFEHQYILSFANRMTDNFSAGITVKMNYAKLYDELTSIVPGFDFGFIYLINPNFSIGASIKEIGSKYKWDTSNLYGQDYGSSTINNFPQITRFGTSYFYEPYNLLLLGEAYEINKNIYYRFGSEFNFNDNFSFRTGIDKYSTATNNPASPTFGFTFNYPFQEYKFALSYAYVLESFGLFNAHWLTLNTTWK